MPSRTGAKGDDPLALVMAPPPDETPDQQVARLAREAEARRISEAIDEQLKQERLQQKKYKIVKLLLLGQSESGKSTTLRQFQRLYTPSAFREERILWRSVIQLNLVRSVRKILDAVAEHSDALYAESLHLRNAMGGVDDGGGDSDGDGDDATFFTDPGSHLHELSMRLLPLRHIEQLLIAKLVPPDEEEATHFGSSTGGFVSVLGPNDASGSGSNGNYAGEGFASGSEFKGHHGGTVGRLHDRAGRNQEIFVRPGTAWKGFVARGKDRPSNRSPSPSQHSHTHSYSQSYSKGHPHHGHSLSHDLSQSIDLHDETTAVLHSCRHDIMELWRDPTVREVLRKKKIRLEEQPGFFLNDLERVTSLKYMPSDDDVLKARLKTVGVSEHRFEMESGRESGTEWRIVDVGGSRSQRPTWIPFFEDVNAIIFLAPISGFDQVLAEDRSVNRLEDSVLLWKMICSNKLLSNVELVLFLNKCDILDRKLKAGVRLAKYVRSFQDRSNDSDTVQKYFKAKFAAIQREYSPNPRKFYGFCTSVTDITTTSGILASVRDMVMREHLKRSKLL
ncbi:G-alpha-domain-containing protein [Fomitiporia mediterranea MF3/22]|uniref:G-alpha-domain-containing protein n=1 Tax=Fomitiporia mediterranea (strain MF3/22) TaxID=694068 RepID=UPI00044088B7|nr:G-alpha-domain-containing protein [Fomitiporia mediterranea MF3/22]EJD05576.1 G-alpha-domain-containing protein [Fomitiporia mediterranea MF3/22]